MNVAATCLTLNIAAQLPTVKDLLSGYMCVLIARIRPRQRVFS